MKNRIVLDPPCLENNIITYRYKVEGPWKNMFKSNRSMSISYSIDLSGIPQGIAVLPFLANLLPMAWVCDAEIQVSVCDRTFYESIPEFKKGYQEMYPMLIFGGELQVGKLEQNESVHESRSGTFFSGGVDAFNTLVCHAKEKPVLLTLWGADVKIENEKGWENVLNHLRDTAERFEVDYVTIKSEFRMFQNESALTEVVKKSGDGWWHGFQHGIGVICHAAPVAWKMGLSTIYFASSFTAADRGKVTCASDPTIDNFVRFGTTKIIHDGYDFNRQMKVHNITQFAKNTGMTIPLRVCWESTGGSNCCNCEKCWRTILAIYAERQDPRNYGFSYENFTEICDKIHHKSEKMKFHRESRYAPIQKAMRANYAASEVLPQLRWFYDININRLGEIPLWRKIVRKVKHIYFKFKNTAIHS